MAAPAHRSGPARLAIFATADGGWVAALGSSAIHAWSPADPAGCALRGWVPRRQGRNRTLHGATYLNMETSFALGSRAMRPTSLEDVAALAFALREEFDFPFSRR